VACLPHLHAAITPPPCRHYSTPLPRSAFILPPAPPSRQSSPNTKQKQIQDHKSTNPQSSSLHETQRIPATAGDINGGGGPMWKHYRRVWCQRDPVHPVSCRWWWSPCPSTPSSLSPFRWVPLPTPAASWAEELAQRTQMGLSPCDDPFKKKMVLKKRRRRI